MGITDVVLASASVPMGIIHPPPPSLYQHSRIIATGLHTARPYEMPVGMLLCEYHGLVVISVRVYTHLLKAIWNDIVYVDMIPIHV